MIYYKEILRTRFLTTNFAVYFVEKYLFLNVFLLALQVVNTVLLIKPMGKLAQGKEALKQYGVVRLSVVKYLLLCVLAILVFVFVGAAFWAAVNAIENTLYNGKFIFLLLWVLLIPLMNLLLLVFKPEVRNISQLKWWGFLVLWQFLSLFLA